VAFLDPSDPVKKILEHLGASIATIAQNCVQTIFGKPCTINDDWNIVERLNGDFPHNVCLGCGSDSFQALAVLGIDDAVVMEYIGSRNGNDILDAFGEMLNIYFAMLMDDVQFAECFGILTQSLAQYSSDTNFYPKAWGYSGTLLTPLEGKMYIGFAIRSIQPVTQGE
jgi:hypothetical protein